MNIDHYTFGPNCVTLLAKAWWGEEMRATIAYRHVGSVAIRDVDDCELCLRISVSGRDFVFTGGGNASAKLREFAAELSRRMGMAA